MKTNAVKRTTKIGWPIRIILLIAMFSVFFAVLSSILCKIIICQFPQRWQIVRDFSYGLRPPVKFHL